MIILKMKTINYLLVLLIFFSLSYQEDVASEIRKQFFANIKKTLEKRGFFNYKNKILKPKNFEKKTLIIDRVELNDDKIAEIGKRYSLDKLIFEQIKAVFFQSQPNIYKDFEFSLNDDDLAKNNNAKFTEYIGCCYRQGNMVNYIIMRLLVNIEIYEKKTVEAKICIPNGSYSNEIKKSCDISLEDLTCDHYTYRYDEKKGCFRTDQLYIKYKKTPLNDDEKNKAKELVSAYFGEIFNLMIEEVQKNKKGENLEIQSIFTSGQIFKNETYYVEAEITNYGEVVIKETSMFHGLLKKECLNMTEKETYDQIQFGCAFIVQCHEREREYLISDENGESSCTKLKLLKNEKKNIEMVIYNDGSMDIKEGMVGAILYSAKPNIKGKGPFKVGVNKFFELQIVDSENVVVWKSTPVHLHWVAKIIKRVKKNPLIPW